MVYPYKPSHAASRFLNSRRLKPREQKLKALRQIPASRFLNSRRLKPELDGERKTNTAASRFLNSRRLKLGADSARISAASASRFLNSRRLKLPSMVPPFFPGKTASRFLNSRRLKRLDVFQLVFELCPPHDS